MARRRVLIVEDYQPLRDLMQTMLQEAGGYAVETAANGDLAERVIVEQPFDLVVLDIGLPGGLSGEHIAALARTRLRCPILFISGRDLAEADCPLYIEPGDSFLRKPFTMDALLAEVSGLVRLGARAPADSSKRSPAREPRPKLMPGQTGS